jgi:hypothetical protein
MLPVMFRGDRWTFAPGGVLAIMPTMMIKQYWKIGQVIGVGVFTTLLVWRFLAGVGRDAVNILYLDQWDFWTPIFRHQGLGTLFWWQHLHRQGIGFVLTGLLAQLTGWNTRAECFMIGGFVIAAMLAALALRWVLFGCPQWWDAVWPAIFLTPLVLLAAVEVPNLSYGVMPLFLLMLCCFCWLIPRRPLAYAALLLVNFNMLFTGFGMFIGIVTPAMLLLEALRAYRQKDRRALAETMAAILVALASVAAYFHGYVATSAVENFKFPDERWYLYPKFVALQMSYLMGISGGNNVPTVVGWGTLVVVAAIWLVHVRRLLGRGPAGRERVISQVIVTLLSFVLLFTSSCAVGRLILGVHAGQSARYLPLLLGAPLGVYFHLLAQPAGVMRNAVLALLAVWLIAMYTWPFHSDAMLLERVTAKKQTWKYAYLATGSIAEANRIADGDIYPRPAATDMEGKLREMKRLHLNLFLDAPATQP